MNALYVTVCIPFLLVLAGFNHAHGFTTFGKTPTNPQTQPPPPHVPARPCGNHTECSFIPQTSCVQDSRSPSKKSCLCGDNKPPQNGQCHASTKGPYHLCSETSECVDRAECLSITNGSPGGNGQESSIKVCKCLEGFVPDDGECSGGGHVSINATLILLLVTALYRTLF